MNTMKLPVSFTSTIDAGMTLGLLIIRKLIATLMATLSLTRGIFLITKNPRFRPFNLRELPSRKIFVVNGMKCPIW